MNHWILGAVAIARILAGQGAVVQAAETAVTAQLDNKLSLPSPLNGLPSDWTQYGTPVFSSQDVQLTSMDAQAYPNGQQASLWTRNTNPHEEWELEVDILTKGDPSGEKAGGGVALWYTAQPLRQAASIGSGVHGSQDPWDGLSLMLDSVGWDDKASTRKAEDNGALRAQLNDGTQRFNPSTASSDAFTMCRVSYRNANAPTSLKLTHTKDKLSLEINGQTCFTTPHVKLPVNYYFGVSAAAEGAAPDAFTITKWKLTSLKTNTQSSESQQKLQTPRDVAPAAISRQVDELKAELLKSIEKSQSLEVNNAAHKTQISGLEQRVARLETMLHQLVESMQTKDKNPSKFEGELDKLHSKLENLDKAMTEYTAEKMNSITQAVKKGGVSLWVIIVIVIVLQGLLLVGYNVYKTRRSYHRKIL